MAKTISDFLPKEKETTMIQAKIDKTLHAKVKQKMDSEKVTWHDLMTASCSAYLEEKPKK